MCARRYILEVAHLLWNQAHLVQIHTLLLISMCPWMNYSSILGLNYHVFKIGTIRLWSRTSLVIQRLRLRASTAGDACLIPCGRGSACESCGHRPPEKKEYGLISFMRLWSNIWKVLSIDLTRGKNSRKAAIINLELLYVTKSCGFSHVFIQKYMYPPAATWKDWIHRWQSFKVNKPL